MILVIDYDMGNIGSVKNMLHRLGCDVMVSNRPADIAESDKLVLPGVGAFDQGVHNLKRLGLFDLIREEVIIHQKPIMGVCLGMQLLGRKSEEGDSEGLGLLEFDSVRFTLDRSYRVPHMGWSSVSIDKNDIIVSNMFDSEQRFYFVHSYHAVCDNADDILMTCEYGYKFVAAVSNEHIYGFQFHPEKSHRYGMQLFNNYVKV